MSFILVHSGIFWNDSPRRMKFKAESYGLILFDAMQIFEYSNCLWKKSQNNDTVCKSNNTRKYLVDMYKWSVLNLQILRRFSFLLELLKEDQFIPILGPIKGEQHILRFLILQSWSRPKCNGIYEKCWQVNEIKFRFLDFML